MNPNSNEIKTETATNKTGKITLNYLLTLEEWASYFKSLSKATGLDVSAYDEKGNLILSTRENPVCKFIKSSIGKTECPTSCEQFIFESMKKREPITYKCCSNVINLSVPINYFGETAAVVGRGGFTSYEDFLGLLKVAKAHNIHEMPIAFPLDFTDENQIKDISKYIFKSTNCLLNTLQGKNILIEKIGRLSSLADTNILGGLSKNTVLIHRYIVDTIEFILGSASVAILSFDQNTSTYKTVCTAGKDKNALSNIELSPENPFIQEVISAKEFPVEIEGEKLITTRTNGEMKSVYFFPIFVSGRMEGLIGVADGKLPREDKKIINTFCDYIEANLENNALRLAIEEKMDGVLASISELSSSIAPELDREKLLQTILEKSSKILKAEQSSLMLLDSETSELLVEAKKSIDNILNEEMSRRKGEGIAGRVLESGTPMLVEDVEKDPRILQKNKPRYKTKSFISVPIKIENRLEGVINMADKTTGEVFNEDDLKFLQSLIGNAAIAIERSMLYKRMEELQHLSTTDPLTGALNRRYLNNRLLEEISRYNRYKQHFSFLMIDIDGFKQYNDTYGHVVGDKVLKAIANTLKGSLRNIDIVARFGGDEFVIILPQTPKKDAINIAKRINENVEKASLSNTDEITQNNLTVSIGLASYPDDASSLTELLEKTDQALYLAKKGGKNRLVYL